MGDEFGTSSSYLHSHRQRLWWRKRHESVSLPAPPPIPPPRPPGPPVNGPAWWGYARDAQHTATGAIASQPLRNTLWLTSVDFAPQYSSGSLLSHYGSPVVSSMNTVLVPVKTTALGGFSRCSIGIQRYADVERVVRLCVAVTSWVPPFNITLTQANRVPIPGAGASCTTAIT